MPYHVSNLATRDEEFEKYVDVLAEFGVSNKRDSKGRTGVVEDRSLALQILARMREAIPHLNWNFKRIDANGVDHPEPEDAEGAEE